MIDFGKLIEEWTMSEDCEEMDFLIMGTTLTGFREPIRDDQEKANIWFSADSVYDDLKLFTHIIEAHWRAFIMQCIKNGNACIANNREYINQKEVIELVRDITDCKYIDYQASRKFLNTFEGDIKTAEKANLKEEAKHVIDTMSSVTYATDEDILDKECKVELGEPDDYWKSLYLTNKDE